MTAKNEFNFRNQQMQKWGFTNQEWHNNGIISGNDIDVAIKIQNNLFSKDEDPYCVWLETKDGNYCSIYEMLAQAIYTTIKIKKKINNDLFAGKYVILPQYLGCFDNEKCALIGKDIVEYVEELSSFDQLKYTPSNLPQDVIDNVKTIIETFSKEAELELYNTNDGKKNLEDFGRRLKQIQNKLNKQTKLEINSKNNVEIYNNYWKKEVAPLIKYDCFDANFPTIEDILPYCYLADLMFDDNIKKPLTISEKLDVVLQYDKNDNNYKYKDVIKKMKSLTDLTANIEITDQAKYQSFWNKYKRPPEEEYRKKIIDRVDLLVSQDLRERDGDFFTPKMWADRGIEYLNKAIGTDQNDQQSWLKDYYVWDCCCGTGNLLQDFRPEFQHKCFLSSLKRCHLRLIKSLGRLPNTPDSQIFQFDFLNDDWKPQAEGGKIPDALWKIIKETPEKLVMFINPPYAEPTNTRQKVGTGKNRDGNASTKLKAEITKTLGACSNELFCQFYYRIYNEIEGCKIGCFSTLKNILGANFEKFRDFFKARFLSGFLVPANTFDNVKGSFPISFQVWGTTKHNKKNIFKFDVFDEKNDFFCEKNCENYNKEFLINNWFECNNFSKEKLLAGTQKIGNDVQHSNDCYMYPTWKCTSKTHNNNITSSNLVVSLIYLSVRTSIPATWLNDRDQFAAPFEKPQDNFKMGQEKHYLYEDDQDFINNCIVYAIFTKNYTDWNLFDNGELNLQNANRDIEVWLFLKAELNKGLTQQAQDVYNSALAICRFYHAKKCGKNYEHNGKIITDYQYKINASWNDILNGVKGVKLDKNGKAKRNNGCDAYPKAEDLFIKFREDLKLLAKEVEKGVYKYGFLRG